MNEQKWVAVWGCAPSIAEPRPARYAKNITLRYILRAPFDGAAIRLHFSNIGSDSPVTLSHVVAAPVTEGNIIDPSAAVTVTFKNENKGILPAGGTLKSDELPLAIKGGSDFAVSIYLEELTHMASGTNCTGPLSRAFFAEGSYAEAAQMATAATADTATFFFLDTVEMLSSADCHAVVCFGDSITAQSWPDYLLLRVLRDADNHTAVVRRGIGGGRVLRAYHHVKNRHYGPAGLERFEKEISAAGVDSVIILHGVNDIIHPEGSEFRPWSDLPTAEELINGLRFYVTKGHEMGKRVYLATIMTIKNWSSFVPLRDDLRHQVNDWIRTQNEADGVVDFDAACRRADDPDLRVPEYDSGDHLHPSLAGAEHMAESVPEAYIK